jgi:thymidine phosphorylase
VDEPERLPRAAVVRPVAAPRGGYVAAIDAQKVGLTAVELGAGREHKEDDIDPRRGHRAGPQGRRARGRRRDALYRPRPQRRRGRSRAAARLLRAYAWSDTPPAPLPLIYEIIRESRA